MTEDTAVKTVSPCHTLSRRGERVMIIDRKFKIAAVNPCNLHRHTEEDAVLFCAKDSCGPAAGGCSYCNHVRRDFPVEQIANPKGLELRCEVMGLKGGRAYRINPNNICDKYDNSNHLRRLGAVWRERP